MLSGVSSKKISCIEPQSSSHTKWQAAGSLPHGCVRVSYVRFRQGTERTSLQGGRARSRLGLPIAAGGTGWWVPCDRRSVNSVTHWQVSSSLQEISGLSFTV